MKRTLNIVGALLLLLNLNSLSSELNRVDPEQGIPLFLKIASYDENLDMRQIDKVVIYLAVDRSSAGSVMQADACHTYFENHKGSSLSGYEIELVDLSIEEIARLEQIVNDRCYNMIFVTDGLAEKIPMLTQQSQTLDIHSYSFQPDDVVLGVSVSVRYEAGKRKILINLGASRAEGASFRASLLNMCEII